MPTTTAMSKPRVHEIFSNQNQPPAPRKDDAKQAAALATKKSFAPMPPMSKFGGYKPKILGGSDDFVPISYDENRTTAPAAQSPESPSQPRPRPVLTKPKPFIIGDKDVPMVLSTPDDNNSDDKNNNDLNIYATVDDMNVSEKEQNGFRFERQNGDGGDIVLSPSPVQEDHSFFPPDDTEDLIGKESTTSFSAKFGTENPAFVSAQDSTDNDESTMASATGSTDDNEHPAAPESADVEHVVNGHAVYENGVHIPEPDYDEDEKCLDFAEEDPDDLLPENNRPYADLRKGHTLPPLSSRVYIGEDWSHYLSDDDDDKEMPIMTTKTGKNKKAHVNGKLSQRHSMFKSDANLTTNGHYNTNSSNSNSKSKSKAKQPVHNNVRNFSYADSKYGTKSRADARAMAPVHNLNNGEAFNDDSYESFLFSRHGHTMPSRISAVNAREMDGWGGGGGGGSKGEDGDDKRWKKFTFKLRNKMGKNGYALKEM